MKKMTTSLVLGSGGARGLSHIGVIRYLEEHGYKIDYISGSSIGALIGGIHAAGKLDVYADWVKGLQRSDVLLLLDPSFRGESLLKGERVINVLRELIGDYEIEALPIGFTAVATDLTNAGAGREVWLSQGSLFEAIRASIAVPTLFSPVYKDGRVLVDGSVLNPLPVAPTLHRHTQLTVAVNLNGRYDASRALPEKKSKPVESSGNAYTDAVSQFVEKFWPDTNLPSPERIGFSGLALRSMETMQASITDFRLASRMPELVIHIPSNLCGFFDFHRADELIAYGYERAEQTVKAVEQSYPGLLD